MMLMADPGADDGPALDQSWSVRLIALDSVTSTNDVAREAAHAGAPEGTLVWAQTQIAGRGRRGRHWESPRGNLYASILLRPGCVPSQATQLSFLAALAVADAVTVAAGRPLPLALKWPNDVLLDGAKLAGVLLEAEQSASGSIEHVVLGIGINIAVPPTMPAYPTTTLAAHGVETNAGELLRHLSSAIGAWYGRWRAWGFSPVRNAWRARAFRLGAPISIRLGDRVLDGTFADLDADGALLLSGPGGTVRVGAGELLTGGQS